MHKCPYVDIHIYDHAHRIENGAPSSVLMQIIPHEETQRHHFLKLFSVKGAGKHVVGRRTIKRENGNRNSYYDSVTRHPTRGREGRSFVSLHRRLTCTHGVDAGCTQAGGRIHAALYQRSAGEAC